MNKVVRWILVLPAMAVAGVAGWAATVLAMAALSFMSGMYSGGPLSVMFGTFNVNFVATLVAVVAGASVAPVKSRSVRIGLGMLVGAFALATFAIDPDRREYMGLASTWHGMAAFAWLCGAVVGVRMADSYASNS